MSRRKRETDWIVQNARVKYSALWIRYDNSIIMAVRRLCRKCENQTAPSSSKSMFGNVYVFMTIRCVELKLKFIWVSRFIAVDNIYNCHQSYSICRNNFSRHTFIQWKWENSSVSIMFPARYHKFAVVFCCWQCSKCWVSVISLSLCDRAGREGGKTRSVRWKKSKNRERMWGDLWDLISSTRCWMSSSSFVVYACAAAAEKGRRKKLVSAWATLIWEKIIYI